MKQSLANSDLENKGLFWLIDSEVFVQVVTGSFCFRSVVRQNIMGGGHRVEWLPLKGQQVEKEKKQGVPLSLLKVMLY